MNFYENNRNLFKNMTKNLGNTENFELERKPLMTLKDSTFRILNNWKNNEKIYKIYKVD